MWLLLTVGGELVTFENSDAEDVLLQVFDKKLTVGVPLRIQRVLQRETDKQLFVVKNKTTVGNDVTSTDGLNKPVTSW